MAKMFYTLDEAKAALGKNDEEIKQYTREGRLREFRDGPRFMYKADQVEALKAELAGEIDIDNALPRLQAVPTTRSRGDVDQGRAIDEPDRINQYRYWAALVPDFAKAALGGVPIEQVTRHGVDTCLGGDNFQARVVPVQRNDAASAIPKLEGDSPAERSSRSRDNSCATF